MLLGSPSEADKSFVTDEKALEYLSSYSKMARVNFRTKFEGVPKHGIDLIERLLQFNPFFRLTLDEAIAHPFFNKIRKQN